MATTDVYINERLDHLGIVAGVCQEIGLYASSEKVRNRYTLLPLGSRLHVPSSRVIPHVQHGSI